MLALAGGLGLSLEVGKLSLDVVEQTLGEEAVGLGPGEGGGNLDDVVGLGRVSQLGQREEVNSEGNESQGKNKEGEQIKSSNTCNLKVVSTTHAAINVFRVTQLSPTSPENRTFSQPLKDPELVVNNVINNGAIYKASLFESVNSGEIIKQDGQQMRPSKKRKHFSLPQQNLDLDVTSINNIIDHVIKHAQDVKQIETVKNDKKKTPTIEVNIKGKDSAIEDVNSVKSKKLSFWLCKRCGQEFEGMVKLKQHIATSHTSEGFTFCHLCEFKCSNPKNISTHIYLQHIGKLWGQFMCELCDYRNSSEELLERHKQLAHRGGGVRGGKRKKLLTLSSVQHI